MKYLVLSIALFSFATAAQAQGWSCSAPGVVSGTYDGGGSAYIHLDSFPSGGTYPVQRNGKRATGTTKNGTRFTCVQK